MSANQGYPHRRSRWGVWQVGVEGVAGGWGHGGGTQGHYRVGIGECDKGKCKGGAIGRYRELVRQLQMVRVAKIVLSGILPMSGGYARNSGRRRRRMFNFDQYCLVRRPTLRPT